jgi:hypothetical protein
MLADNFLRIALYDEYSRQSGGFVRAETESSILRRWEFPSGWNCASAPRPAGSPGHRPGARRQSYLARLARITGHADFTGRPQPELLRSISCPKTNARRWGR